MNIRRATLDDIPVLVSYGEKFWEFTRYKQVDEVPYNPESVEALCRGLMTIPGTGYVLVVEVEGVVKGFGLCVTTPLIWNHKYAVSGELAYYLDEELRGSGAGVRLLTAMEKYAIKRKCHYMAMISMDHSMDVGPLYEKMGYVRTETTYTKRLNTE